MMRMKTASLAILGAAAIVASVLAGPAMAKETMAKGTKDKQAIKQTQTLAKGQRHMQRHTAYRTERFRSANAALTSGRSDRRAAGPGGAAATAGAPFRAWDNNYYGYGYGGRDWKTYAAHNGLACAPGSTFRGADGKRHLCQ